MKVLFDENLSRKLAGLLQSLFPGSVHITQTGLSAGTLDRDIWDYAKRNGFAIITADRDFLTLAKYPGSAAKGHLLGELRLPDRHCGGADSLESDPHFRIFAQ